MAAADLVFQSARATTGDLVFGDDGDTPVSDAIVGGVIALARPGISGRLALGLVASGAIALKRPKLAGEVIYNTDTQRPLVARVAARFQDARPVEIGVEESARDAVAAAGMWRVRFQEGTKVQLGARARFADASSVHRLAGVRFQDSAREGAGFTAGFQDARRLDAWRDATFQEAAALDSRATSLRFQEATAVRSHAAARFQDALRLELAYQQSAADGLFLEVGRTTRFQNAIWPPPGRTSTPEPPKPEPCYLPDPNLVFSEAWSADTSLVFVCERHGASPAPLVIPLLRYYMATHSIVANLLPTLEPVRLFDVSISADWKDPVWSLSATGPLHLLDQLKPNPLPRQIWISVDGMPWTFIVEGFRRVRDPGQRLVQITGRSATALIGGPKIGPQTWLNAEAKTAQQLVLDALEFTGVDLEWQIPDWVVPAGAWSFRGTPLAAAVRVADSVGAVLQSHPTAAKLTVMPRYPLMPWEWSAPESVPDVAVSSAAITTDQMEVREEPAWDAVYVCGTTQGVIGHVRRAGTAGAVLAPLVTDDLITHVDAARERGRSILGAGGRQADLEVSLPILTGGTLPGALRINQLLHVTEPNETWRGMVRGISLRGGGIEWRQTARVERHLA